MKIWKAFMVPKIKNHYEEYKEKTSFIRKGDPFVDGFLNDLPVLVTFGTDGGYGNANGEHGKYGNANGNGEREDVGGPDADADKVRLVGRLKDNVSRRVVSRRVSRNAHGWGCSKHILKKPFTSVGKELRFNTEENTVEVKCLISSSSSLSSSFPDADSHSTEELSIIGT